MSRSDQPAVDLASLRIGYVPYDTTLRRPGDRRRFPFFAQKRGLQFEIADPSQSYDLVVLSARADISVWARVPRGRTKLVYDLIDSYLEVPRFEAKSMLRGTAKFLTRETSRLVFSYGRAIEDMCRRADAVVCSTPEQQASISRLNPNVHPILDFHGPLICATKTNYRRRNTLNLVWEGQPENLSSLEVATPALLALQRDIDVALHLITDLQYHKVMGRYLARETQGRARALFANSYLYQWNEHMLAPIATSCDMGIIPLPADDRLMRAKPENKLLLLWRMGIPAIVSATPAYTRTMDACGLDMICHSGGDWNSLLRRYGTDESGRQRAGKAGQAYSEAQHGEERLFHRWNQMLATIL